MAEYLTDEQRIENIAACISWKKARALAVIYFGITQTKLDNYDEQDYNSGRYIDEWRKGDENRGKQELADILFDACDQYSSVGRREIKEHLGIKAPSGKPVLQPDSTVNSHLTESELGRLAMKITKGNLRQLATLLMGNEHDHLNNIEDEHKKDPFLAKFQIFVEWKKKHEADDERKKLARALYKAAKERSLFNIRDIKLILNVTKEQAFAEDAGDAAGDATDGRVRKEEAKKVTDSGDKITKVEPQTPALSLGSGTPLPAVAAAASASDSNLMFPEGTAKNSEDFKSYDWLGMTKIKNVTAPMTSKLKRPICVAVIDSGIRGDFPTLHLPVFDMETQEMNLNDFILRDTNNPNILSSYHHNFVDGQDDDLWLDSQGHGTFVAGIIALNGPVNVKIINLKVMHDNIAKFEHLIAALEHVETIDEVDIINISLGFKDLNSEMVDKLKDVLYRLSKTKIVIAAAGNEGSTSNDPVTHPARDNATICVGGCTQGGNPTDFTPRGQEVTFLCPAERVFSLNSKFHVQGAPLCYASNGTSFAAPYACAIAAHVLVASEAKLLAELNPDGTPKYTSDQAFELRNKLRRTTTMRYILESMTIHKGNVAPWEKSFENLPILWIQCDNALKDKRT